MYNNHDELRKSQYFPFDYIMINVITIGLVMSKMYLINLIFKKKTYTVLFLENVY